ncbi:MAG: hypothetical protein PVF47_11190 [Anaerolineae bacterium]|jgi:hypothetical protein
MTEEQKPKPESNILAELNALGQQLTTAVKALWESEDSRNLRQEIREGFVQLGEELDETIKSAQDSEAAQEFRSQVHETMDKARESDVVGQVEQGLLSGLTKMNQELSKMVDSLREEGAVEAAEATEAEDEVA